MNTTIPKGSKQEGWWVHIQKVSVCTCSSDWEALNCPVLDETKTSCDKELLFPSKELLELLPDITAEQVGF